MTCAHTCKPTAGIVPCLARAMLDTYVVTVSGVSVCQHNRWARFAAPSCPGIPRYADCALVSVGIDARATIRDTGGTCRIPRLKQHGAFRAVHFEINNNNNDGGTYLVISSPFLFWTAFRSIAVYPIT